MGIEYLSDIFFSLKMCKAAIKIIKTINKYAIIIAKNIHVLLADAYHDYNFYPILNLVVGGVFGQLL